MYYFNRGSVNFIDINILYIVLVVIYLSESVYRQAQATLPILVVNKINHVCTFCLYGLKDCNCSFYSMYFVF